MKHVIKNIHEIVKPYNALIIDIWGVIYDGTDPYKDAVACLNKMMADCKTILFLSNAPRPGILSKQRFIDWGINMQNALVYTSGDAVREQLISWNDEVFKNLGRKIYHLGEEKNQDILAGIDVNLVQDIKLADFLLITNYTDEAEELNSYDSLFKQAIDLNLPAICANPDIGLIFSNSVRYCAGSFAKKYSELGGIVHYYGKPDVRIYNTVLERYLSKYERNKILMIGDTIETDVVGAKAAGIDSTLVLTGNGQKFVPLLNNHDIFKNCPAEPNWLCHGLE